MKYIKFWRFLWPLLFISFLTFCLATCQKDNPLQPEPEPEKHWVADTTLIPQILSKVDSPHIRSSIQTLQDFGTRYAYSPKCFEAAEWIRSEMERYGYSVEYQSFYRRTLQDIYFLGENKAWAVGNYGLILKSNDGGISWEHQETNTGLHLFGIYFLDEKYGWIWGDRISNDFIVLFTTDGGETWQKMNPIIDNGVRSVFFQNRMKGWMGIDNTLYRTTDGGVSWTTSFIGGLIYDIFFLSDSLGFFGAGSGHYKTVNGGDTWEKINTVPYNLESIQFYNDFNGMIVSENGTIVMTDDGGKTWTAKKISDHLLYDGAFISREKLIVVGTNVYLLSYDNGKNWHEIEKSGFIRAVDFKNDREGFMVGPSVFRKTIDGAQTWTNVVEGIPMDVLWHNIKAVKSGRIELDKKIIVGAHYDSRSGHRSYYEAPGADDNASGTAGVLELARVFKDFDFNRTVEFILFSGEEQGLRGSYYSAAISRQNAEDIVGMINLDMIGYCPDNVYDIGIYSLNPDFRSSFIQETSKYANINYYEFDQLMSDEKSYYDRDYPALGILEYTLPSVRSYPWYHSVNDKIDKLNMGFTTAVVQFTTAGLFSLITPVVLKPIQ